MPLVDTQRYEIFDHMHLDIPEGGQPPELPYKSIAKKILCTLIEPNFEIKAGTSRMTCKRCSHLPFQGTYARGLEHLLIL